MFGLSQLEERLIWAALVLVVIVGAAWHERRIGAAGCVQSVKNTNAASELKEEKQRTSDVETVHHEGTTYALQIAAPVFRAPVLRLCPDLPRPPLQAGAAPGADAHAEAAGREGDQAEPAAWDSTPVVRAGRDADAQIAGLQDYILNVCRPK